MLTLCWIPRKRAEPWQFFLTAIEEQLPVGVRSVLAKNVPVNIDVDLYTLNILILPKTCSKVRNSVFGRKHSELYLLTQIAVTVNMLEPDI